MSSMFSHKSSSASGKSPGRAKTHTKNWDILLLFWNGCNIDTIYFRVVDHKMAQLLPPFPYRYHTVCTLISQANQPKFWWFTGYLSLAVINSCPVILSVVRHLCNCCQRAKSSEDRRWYQLLKWNRSSDWQGSLLTWRIISNNQGPVQAAAPITPHLAWQLPLQFPRYQAMRWRTIYCPIDHTIWSAYSSTDSHGLSLNPIDHSIKSLSCIVQKAMSESISSCRQRCQELTLRVS